VDFRLVDIWITSVAMNTASSVSIGPYRARRAAARPVAKGWDQAATRVNLGFQIDAFLTKAAAILRLVVEWAS
jgi:hypothetical protein